MEGAKVAFAANIEQIATLGLQWLLVWLLGLSLGWLLPRPSWIRRVKTVLRATPPLAWSGRIALAVNGALVVREVWYKIATPGTFRGFVSTILAWFSEHVFGPSYKATTLNPDALNNDENWVSTIPNHANWPVTTDDLQQLVSIVDLDEKPAGYSNWEAFCSKDWPTSTYTAWRRTKPSGKTEYKSITVACDTTPQEFIDFYFDDNSRGQWDAMITETELLEVGPKKDRCQVVRWIRSFPFSFISKREYVIARRVFKAPNGDMYAVTKSVDHAAAPLMQGVVRMEDFYSMWRCRQVPCPKGSDKPACETTLLHFEDFRIPENLARFAVRHGMASFVTKLVQGVSNFVAQRRERVPAHQEDPNAFGSTAKLGLQRTLPAQLPRTVSLTSEASTSSSSVETRTASLGDDSASEQHGHLPRTPSVRRLGYMLLASGVAVALSRTNSGMKLNEQATNNNHHHRQQRKTTEEQQQQQQEQQTTTTTTNTDDAVTKVEQSGGVAAKQSSPLKSHRLASHSTTHQRGSRQYHRHHHAYTYGLHRMRRPAKHAGATATSSGQTAVAVNES